MKPIVLFLDDELSLLQSIRRVLRTEEYSILTASSGKEALSLLEKETISVVVTDLRMPQMGGMRFLEEANRRYPNPVYILCTAYADIQTVMDAFNKKLIWHFITKPWSEENFKITIQNGIDYYEEKAKNSNLMKTLQQKNRDLATLNGELEKRIEERTKHLHNEKDILSMILQDVSSVTIIHKICSIIDTLIAPDTISISVPFLQRRFYQKREELLDKLLPQEEDALQSQRPLSSDTALYIPLAKDSISIGVATIHTEDHQKTYRILKEEISKSYLYLLELALFQEKNLHDIPELEATVELLLGEL